jgi:hypothetical protein
MRFKFLFIMIFLFFSGLMLKTYGQQKKNYDLVKLFQENKLDSTCADQQTRVLNDPERNAISTKGILWISGVNFKEGIIDIDLRGKNFFLQSFLGIAFHAKDTNNYDVVYFCPFRFHDKDSVTKKYSVKYMSLPDYSYTRLRKEHPGVYENEVNPAPQADEWFHATIVIRNQWVTVYINHSAIQSLKVKKLDTLTEGKIGLWSYSQTLSSDFANLTINFAE